MLLGSGLSLPCFMAVKFAENPPVGRKVEARVQTRTDRNLPVE